MEKQFFSPEKQFFSPLNEATARSSAVTSDEIYFSEYFLSLFVCGKEKHVFC